MRTLLNIIWVVLGGFWLFLGYVFFGLIACLFIVTIPAGIASFRIAAYVLWPFGREVVPAPGAGAMTGISNVIWFLVAGLWLAIGHVTQPRRPSPSLGSRWPWPTSSSSLSPASPSVSR